MLHISGVILGKFFVALKIAVAIRIMSLGMPDQDEFSGRCQVTIGQAHKREDV